MLVIGGLDGITDPLYLPIGIVIYFLCILIQFLQRFRGVIQSSLSVQVFIIIQNGGSSRIRHGNDLILIINIIGQLLHHVFHIKSVSLHIGGHVCQNAL